MRTYEPFFFRSLKPTALLALGLLALALAGCQGRLPVERIPRQKWLVLPLSQPPAMRTTPRAIQGWWLGARTIRQSPRSGDQAAEMLARRLAALDVVNLYSTIDLRYYFTEKRQALENAYPYLSQDEIRNLTDEISPVLYGRELGADRVLTGRIVRLYMADNRTIHWWWSVGEIEFQLIDVASGDVVWQRLYTERQQFGSQSSVLEDLTLRVIDDLEQDIFRPMAQ